ncbi:hypothetical protein EC991_003945 [Linnemannia zychae]|nr:hypothetical protein EC991_003945 [Linnemannia zychae]
MSPRRPYSGDEKYRKPYHDSPIKQQHQQPQEHSHGAPNYQNRGSYYTTNGTYGYDGATPLAQSHHQLSAAVVSKSNGKKRDVDGNGGSKRREGLLDNERLEGDSYYHKKAHS